MKKTRIIMPFLGFLFAVISAFSTTMLQTGYFDSNDGSAGGGTEGTIDQTNKNCQVQSGTICTIQGEWAFNTPANAEANQGQTSNPSATGLLKHQ